MKIYLLIYPFLSLILLMIQSYVYTDVKFLFSYNLSKALRCNALIWHKCSPLREASRKEWT